MELPKDIYMQLIKVIALKNQILLYLLLMHICGLML